jgi:hypothetical protein
MDLYVHLAFEVQSMFNQYLKIKLLPHAKHTASPLQKTATLFILKITGIPLVHCVVKTKNQFC